MSRSLTKSELDSIIGIAISKINELLYEYLHLCEDDKYRKRAALIAYWIIDYVKYIREEDNFVPENLIKYSRGDLLIVNFGYRIGRELGGRHFAIVLDMDNSKYSPNITVIPLTSLKNTTKKNKFVHILKDDIPKLYQRKSDEIIGVTNTISNAKRKINSMSNYEKDIINLKEGSVAQIGQITTISKQRIVSPKNTNDALYGLKISTDDLDAINEKVKNLYVFMNKT